MQVVPCSKSMRMQAEQLRPVLESQLILGEDYSLISAKWLQQWKEYTKYEAATNEHYFDVSDVDRCAIVILET